MATTMLPLDRIHPNPANIRDALRDLDELTESVRAVGILQPITLTADKTGRFLIVDGHRRYEAARRAGLPAAPVIAKRTRDHTDQLFLMLAAGLHDPLTPLEEARAFGRLRDQGVAFTEMARRSGRSQATVRERLALLRLPDEAQDMLTAGRLSLTAAVDLARGIDAGDNRAVPARAAGRRPGWFTKTHRLAGTVREACTHRDTRQVIGTVGCGQCWERAITDEARAGGAA